ncbi:flavin reductase family protein [Candidatus Enterococcus courvalinii]|uniref:Flavin reductase family protein n=1 Tax=Candidatus Enterococcus courvalinii TaxID=2815329 RepID=A0ABS3HXA8_9ENTE|nr:flavin reductase family protein [Enterococcus sp. MSG2901]MBO0481104.1 flavin reductase family protein [Enterococcus sp. MSG2901]
MIQKSPSELTERENYKLLIGSIVPRPVALVTTRSENGSVNVAPFSYFSIVSSNPPIVSLAIQRKTNKLKDTAANLLTTKEAVIHILDEDNVVDGNQTAATLPKEESELSRTTFSIDDAQTVGAPVLRESKIRFETELYQRIEIKENEQITADLFLLKIKHYQVDESVYDEGRILIEKLKPVSRLAGNNYAKIGEIFTLVRPD